MSTDNTGRPKVITRTLVPKRPVSKAGIPRGPYNTAMTQPVPALAPPENSTRKGRKALRGAENTVARRLAGNAQAVHDAFVRNDVIEETSVDRAVRNAKDGTLNYVDAFPEPPPEAPESYKAEFDKEQAEARFDSEKLRDERNYRHEYQLRMVHRMSLMNFSIQDIARKLNTTYDVIHEIKQELYRRQRYEAKNMDGMYFIGKGLATIKEVQSLAFRMAADARTPPQHKLGAMMAMLASVNTEKRFMESFGFQEQHRYTPPPDAGSAQVEKGRKSLDILVDLSARLNSGEDMSSFEAANPEEEQTEGERFDDGISFC